MQSLVEGYNKLMDGRDEIFESCSKSFIECRENVEKRREAIRRRWEEKRWSAAVWRDYQLETAQRLFEAEVEAVEREFEEERAKLKEKLISELLEERKRLMDELEPTLTTINSPIIGNGNGGSITNSTNTNGSINNEGTGKRMLRKRNATTANASAISSNIDDMGSNGHNTNLKTLSGKETGSGRRRPPPANPFDQLGKMGIETRLPEDEICDDINSIYRDDVRSNHPRRAALRAVSKLERDEVVTAEPQPIAHPVSNRRVSSNGPKGPTAVVSAPGESVIDAFVADNHLHYASHVFSKGDPIDVLVTQSDSMFRGSISTIGVNELWIRREDGTKNKIYLGQLRVGKYKLSPSKTSGL